MDSEWLLVIKNNIDKQKESIHKRDASFFQLDQLYRMAQRLDHNQGGCSECKQHKIVMEEITATLSVLINSGPSKKRDFEKKTDAIRKHLKLVHQIFPVYYFVSLFSFLGLAAGAIAGLLAGLIFSLYFIQILLVASVVGLIAGYFVGNKKDWAVRYEKRLL